MLRIAVVGATGRIGRPLCRELIKAGHVVTVISRDPARAAAVVQGADGYEAGIIRFALEHQDIDGPLNLTAPSPVTGREFAASLGQVLGRRAWLPVPSPLVRMGLGVITDILVRGKRVIPAKAASAGYQFRFPEVEAALRDLVAERGADR
jgi:NAD dependent epimerase/dehydratase family enzyme